METGRRSKIIQARKKRKIILAIITALLILTAAILIIVFTRKKPEELPEGTTSEEAVTAETEEKALPAAEPEAGEPQVEKSEEATSQEKPSESETGKTTTDLKEDAGEGISIDTNKEDKEDAGTASPSKDEKKSSTIAPEDSAGSATVISEQIKDLSLEDKISCLVIPSPEAFVKREIETDGVTMVGEATQKCLDSHPYVAGFNISHKNIENSDQLEEFIAKLQEGRNNYPMIFMFSEEELRGNENLTKLGETSESNVFLGPLIEKGTYDEASQAGKQMGDLLNKYSINVYVTPDLNTTVNKKLEHDTDAVGGYIENLKSQGIHVCAAYFPGKSYEKDADGFLYSGKTRYELQNEDSQIIKHAVDSGADMLMVPNIRVPQVLSGGEVASMSNIVMNDLIRKEMGFKGVIITDVISRDQLAGQYTTAQAAVAALKAGADMVLIDEDYEETLNGIKNAVAGGELNEDQINESVQRVYDLMTR